MTRSGTVTRSTPLPFLPIGNYDKDNKDRVVIESDRLTCSCSARRPPSPLPHDKKLRTIKTR